MIIPGVPVNTQHHWSTLKKLMWQRLHGGSSLPWSTFSGNPLQFNAPKAHTLRSTSVSFTPIQDLHGYDSPWPAGGGKNKCYIEDFTDTVFGLSVSAVNNVLTLSGTNTSTVSANNDVWKHIKFSVTEAGRYAISFYPSLPTGLGYYVYDSAMNTVPLYANVPVGDYTIGIYIPANTALNASMQFQIEAGTTATSFAPYENICPIDGWTGVDIYRAGENVLGGIDLANTIRRGAYVFSIDTSAKTFTFDRSNPISEDYKRPLFEKFTSARVTAIITYSNQANNNSLTFYYTDGTLSNIMLPSSNGIKTTVAVVSTAGKTVSSFGLYYMSNGKTTVYYEESGLFNGVLTADDFKPYIGETIPLTWTSQGTVYGGKAEILQDGSVRVTIDKASVDLGTLSWFFNTTQLYFSADISDMGGGYTYASDITDILMSIAKYKGAGVGWANLKNGEFGVNLQNIRLKLTDYTATADLVQAIRGQTMTYPLATPTTFTLPSIEALRAYKGINIMWSDANGDLEVEAQANEVPSNSSQSFSLGSPLSVDDTALNDDTALWHEDDYSESGLLTED